MGWPRRRARKPDGELAALHEQADARLKAAREQRDAERRKLREEQRTLVVPIREELKSNHFAQLATDAFRRAR